MDAELMDLFAMASVISAAHESGLTRALSSGPLTAQAYAAQLGLDPRATAMVLDGLTALDVAAREGDAYDASPRLKAMMGSWGKTGLPVENLWHHVPTFLRTGEPFVRMDETIAQREAMYSGVVSALARLSDTSARELAEKLPEAPARVLDVGCGSGVWSLAIAARFPGTRVTGLDLPAVLESFMARARSLDLSDRTATIASDMHGAELPEGGFDLVLIANVLRLEQPDRAAALLARLARAVAPGGALVVVDALAAGTKERERARAFYTLNLAMRTRSGRVHSPAEIRAWLSAAGLGAIQSIDFSAQPGAMGALLARR